MDPSSSPVSASWSPPKPSKRSQKENISDEIDPSSTSSDYPTTLFHPYNPHAKTVQEVIGSHVYDPQGKNPAAIQTRTVNPSDPIVSQWNDIAPQIITLLKDERVQWVAVELFKRAQVPSPESFTTVLVTVEDIRHPSLTIIAEKSFQLCHHAFIEIVEGSLQLQMDFEQLLGPLKVPYNRVPQMGASIGVSNNNYSAGTLGGYVELYDSMGGKRTCALTCHHVICPPEGPQIDPTAADFFPFERSARIMGVESPGLLDHQKSVDTDQERLNTIQVKKAEHISKMELLGDQVPENRKRGLERLNEQEEAFLNRVKLAMATRRDIGTVFATSGYRVSSTNCRLDWGLVELHEDRIGRNKMPNGAQVVSRELEAFEVGEEVVKLGRSTGETLGRVNPAESYVHFPDTSYEQFSRELVVAGTARRFSETGDSGSFVISPLSKELIGIVWGGLTTREATFVTPIESVKQDILEITGCKARLLGE